MTAAVKPLLDRQVASKWNSTSHIFFLICFIGCFVWKRQMNLLKEGRGWGWYFVIQRPGQQFKVERELSWDWRVTPLHLNVGYQWLFDVGSRPFWTQHDSDGIDDYICSSLTRRVKWTELFWSSGRRRRRKRIYFFRTPPSLTGRCFELTIHFVRKWRLIESRDTIQPHAPLVARRGNCERTSNTKFRATQRVCRKQTLLFETNGVFFKWLCNHFVLNTNVLFEREKKNIHLVF